jgi:hypothetical protein
MLHLLQYITGIGGRGLGVGQIESQTNSQPLTPRRYINITFRARR